MEKIKSNDIFFNKITLIFASILLVGSYLVSGIYGLKVVLILILFFIPFYLIFSLFDFSLSEKILFSLFISLTFFAYIVYWVMQITHSYRISLVVSYLILIVVYFVLLIFLKKPYMVKHKEIHHLDKKVI